MGGGKGGGKREEGSACEGAGWVAGWVQGRSEGVRGERRGAHHLHLAEELELQLGVLVLPLQHLAEDPVRHHLSRALLEGSRHPQRLRGAVEVAQHHLLVRVLGGVLRLLRLDPPRLVDEAHRQLQHAGVAAGEAREGLCGAEE